MQRRRGIILYFLGMRDLTTARYPQEDRRAVKDQIQVVEETLSELGIGEIPTFMVFNKIDAFTFVQKDEDDLTPDTRENLSLDDIRKDWKSRDKEVLFISAKKKTNIDSLKDQLYQKVKEVHIKRYPYNNFLY